MNVYNQFLEKINHKNRINSILYDDINDKLLSNQERKTSLNLLLSTRPEIKENINKIKFKYGIIQNVMDQQKVQFKISQLKKKYLEKSADKYKINNVNMISYINNNKKKNNYNNESFQNNNNNKIKGHSIDLERIKNSNSSFYNNNNNNEKEKISLGLSSEQLMNINNSIINENQNIKQRKENDYENYVKSTRNDFYLIDKKVNEILKNERISSEKRTKFNNIYPISQRINMLNNVKNEIKIINRNYDNNINNSSVSQFSNSFTTLGFKYINPKFKRSSIYSDIFRNKIDEYGSFVFNEISKENELDKPVLIRGLSKPKLNIKRFSKFCENIEEE